MSPVVGANLDPSHLFWQGIDPVAAIRLLGDAIHYFHAKDTKIDEINSAQNGVLDTKHYGDEIHRGWLFRTIGYGHGFQVWNDIFSNLRMAGYEGEILSSNWQAGRAYSHFANLHSDYLVGTIDRHNYFGGERANASMLTRAGSGMLSSGMQQVADRPVLGVL